MTHRRELMKVLSLGTMAVPMFAQDRTPAPALVLDSEKFRQAVAGGDLATVKRLLDLDPALLYSRDVRGRSAFTQACLAGQTAVREELSRRGAVTDIFDAAACGDTARAGK